MRAALLFPDALKQLRFERGLTQAALAAAASCSISLVRKYESGARRPTYAIASRLAAALQLSDQEQAQFLRLALDEALALPAGAGGEAQPGWVPAAPTPLIGREGALGELVEAVRQAPGRLVTVTGPPGVGKSRLALAGALALRTQLPDGVWCIELGALGNAEQVLAAVAMRLGVALHGDAFEELAAALRLRRLLLLLDNCEHLPAIGPLVARLLSHAPELRVLATSRVPLRIRAEQRIVLPPLALPTASTLAAVAAAPAAQLFCARAAAASPAFRLTLRNAASVATLCARLDGLPLAIELVAAHSDQFEPPTLLSALDQSLSGSEAPLVDLPPHQQTLAATIAWSERLLPDRARDAFVRLGVFAGSFTASLAAAIGVTTLEPLVEHSLLQRDAEGRYRMLETVRAYAAARLRAAPEAEKVDAEHAQAMAALAEAQRPLLNTPQQATAIAALNAQLPDLRAALRWSCRAEGGIAAARITVALRYYWLNAGAVRDGRLIEGFLREQGADLLPPSLRTQTYLTLGYLASQQADPACRELLEQGVALAQAHDRSAELYEARYLQVLLARYPGNLERCRLLLDEAIASARARGDSQQLAAALNQLGVVYAENDEPHIAVRRFEEALTVALPLGRATIVQRYQSDLAGALAALGERAKARMILEAICAEPADPNDHTARWETQLRLAQLEMQEGALDRAAALLDAAAAAVAQLGIDYGQTLVLRQQGYLALLGGDELRARRLLKETAERAARTFFIEELMASLIGLARALLQTDSAQAARHCGAFEGLRGRFPARVDPLSAGCHESVRRTLHPRDAELADAAAHAVLERIAQVAFPDNYAATDALQLERVVAAALRVT